MAAPSAALPAAEAAPNGNIVALGDFFSANLDQVRNTVRGSGILGNTPYLRDYPKTEVKRIRSVAPQAKLVIVGTLAVTDARGNYCAINVVPNAPLPLSMNLITNAERSNVAMQARAAREIGAQFVEMRGKTYAQHSSCAPDKQRYVAGVVDTTIPNYNMMFHPSREGSRFIARNVAAVL